MPHWPRYGRIAGPIVMIGFGSIGKGTLPLIERHFEFDQERFVVIDPNDAERLSGRLKPRLSGRVNSRRNKDLVAKLSRGRAYLTHFIVVPKLVKCSGAPAGWACSGSSNFEEGIENEAHEHLVGRRHCRIALSLGRDGAGGAG